jgi:hypothetical protein
VAKNYETAGSRQTVQVVSQTQVAPVQAVNIYTKPHASYVVVLVPLSEYQAGNADKYLEPVATVIEQVWSDGFISGTQFVQEIDPATGLFDYFVDFTVSWTPGGGLAVPYTTIVRAPVASLNSTTAFITGADAPGVAIADAYSVLVKTSQL